jgi:hydroxyacyl-ACP dehydratase HTD2-like protein with hotdog domain
MSRVLFPSRRLLQQCSTRRYYSIPAESTSRIASDWLSRITARGPVTKTQYIDANQLQLFSLTLDRPNVHPGVAVDQSPPPKGTPIPPGYHLAYFTVPILEKELGLDGTDTSYNPDAPFTRRMWAGGEVKWVGGDKNPLRVGQEVQETTQILSAEAKVTKRGEEMIVVGLEKKFENEGGVAVIDNRCAVGIMPE